MSDGIDLYDSIAELEKTEIVIDDLQEKLKDYKEALLKIVRMGSNHVGPAHIIAKEAIEKHRI